MRTLPAVSRKKTRLTDSWLGDALNVVTKNLAVALGTTLAEALAALAACRGTRQSSGNSNDSVERCR